MDPKGSWRFFVASARAVRKRVWWHRRWTCRPPPDTPPRVCAMDPHVVELVLDLCRIQAVVAHPRPCSPAPMQGACNGVMVQVAGRHRHLTHNPHRYADTCPTPAAAGNPGERGCRGVHPVSSAVGEGGVSIKAGGVLCRTPSVQCHAFWMICLLVQVTCGGAIGNWGCAVLWVRVQYMSHCSQLQYSVPWHPLHCQR